MEAAPLKIYFLPFLASGHIIPLVHIARLFASQGEHVTLIMTPSNAKLFTNTIEQDRVICGSIINIHTLNFPYKELGLPQGLENVSSATNNDSATKICIGAHLLQRQVEAFLTSNPPHVIVTDFMFMWSQKLATTLGIPNLVFNAISIFASCVMDSIKRNPNSLISYDDHGSFVIPDLPHPITLNVKPSPMFTKALTEGIIENEQNSDNVGILLNGFEEIEHEYAEHYEKLTGRKVWHVGPALLMLKKKTNMDKDLLGDEQQHECLNWLDKQEQKSVVYISFGSVARFSDGQLLEIASGLEASGHKFLWVVHGKDNNDNDNKTWLPLGFEARMKKEDRMMIFNGWAPQVLILNHSAIGAFFTHSGWNAISETIVAGVPMITMPGFGDQYFNEKLITQVRGFGVEVGGQVWSSSPYGDRDNLVGRERIEIAVRKLMDGGDEAVQVRKRAEELQEKAQKAVQPGKENERYTVCIALADDTCEEPKIRMNKIAVAILRLRPVPQRQHTAIAV
ncbi:unnamed protein product [Lupinus luteus]|uniref:Glycosyltransferase n=1 Tax=Lupinus luteus TaxID=3873 RepID=A0AAV1XL86_LUPLU